MTPRVDKATRTAGGDTWVNNDQTIKGREWHYVPVFDAKLIEKDLNTATAAIDKILAESNAFTLEDSLTTSREELLPRTFADLRTQLAEAQRNQLRCMTTQASIAKKAITERDALATTVAELQKDQEATLIHLGNCLDEVWTTTRGEWPRDLFCIECKCCVSKQESHKQNCHLGQAIAFWDAMQAKGEASSSNPR